MKIPSSVSRAVVTRREGGDRIEPRKWHPAARCVVRDVTIWAATEPEDRLELFVAGAAGHRLQQLRGV